MLTYKEKLKEWNKHEKGYHKKMKPIYDKLKGWGNIPDNIWDKGFDQLPIEIKDYISFIEERIDCKVTILSVGPQRHETIIRQFLILDDNLIVFQL